MSRNYLWCRFEQLLNLTDLTTYCNWKGHLRFIKWYFLLKIFLFFPVLPGWWQIDWPNIVTFIQSKGWDSGFLPMKCWQYENLTHLPYLTTIEENDWTYKTAKLESFQLSWRGRVISNSFFWKSDLTLCPLLLKYLMNNLKHIKTFLMAINTLGKRKILIT